MTPESPKDIATLLARDAERVCQQLWPAGKREGHEWRVGDVFGSDGHSLACELHGSKAGMWCDFAEKDTHKGDLLDAWAMRYGLDLAEAMKEARSFLGIAPIPVFRKPKPAKPCQRPAASKAVAPESPVMTYLHGRGLKDETIKAFHILEQPNSFSEHPDNSADIVFPYLVRDAATKSGLRLVNNKYLALKRSVKDDGTKEKNIRLEKDCDRILFGWHLIPQDARQVVLTEGECFPGHAEILTLDGWVSFVDYQGGAVAQWHKDGKIDFVEPIARIAKPWEGSLLRRKWRGYCSETTPDHKIVSLDCRGRVYTHTANDGPTSTAHKIPRCGIADGPGIPLTDSQLALCIAVSADAAIDQRVFLADTQRPLRSANNRYARFGFKRQRKIDRLRKLLIECGINASDTVISSGYQSICFGLPDWIPGRLLPWGWIAQASAVQREFIIAELTHWDGNSVPNRNMTEYSSKYLENAAWVQALAHTSGRCSSIVDRKNQYGEWFKVTILNNKQTSSWQQYKDHTQQIPYCGTVYCVQVPSGMLLVRQDRQITVTGNCDAMTWHQMGAPALSVPNGATSHKWLEEEADRLMRFDEIFLSFDMDKAGETGVLELAERLGRHRCRIVKLPYKDANECLQKGMTGQGFADCLRQSACLRPEEFITFQEGIELVKEQRRQAAARNGVPEGVTLPWPKASQFYMVPGHLTVWTGYASHGKTTLLSHVIAAALRDPDGERACIASLEMTAEDTVDRLCKQLAGRSTLSEPELDVLGDAVQDRCVIYHHVGTSSVDKVLEIFTYARLRHGVTQFVVDSLMMLGIGFEDYDKQLATSQRLIAFAREHRCHVHLVIHPRKPTDEGKAPAMYDVKGSGGLVDGAHNVVVAWRNKKKHQAQQAALLNGSPMDPRLADEPDTTITIEKNRLNGWTAMIPLWFHADSQQFLEQPTDYPVMYVIPTVVGTPF